MFLPLKIGSVSVMDVGGVGLVGRGKFDNKNGWICISPKYKIINNFVKCEYRKETEIDCHEQCLTCLLLRNGECQCIESKLQINFEYIC